MFPISPWPPTPTVGVSSSLSCSSLLTAGALSTRGSVPAKAQSSNQDIVRLACSIPHEQLLRTYRGWRPDRGAQISFIPKEPNFVGSGLPHVGPWDYIQTRADALVRPRATSRPRAR